MGKIEKSEPAYSRWMEIFAVLLAAIMIFFGWKEYKLVKQAEKLQEEQILSEQMKAEQLIAEGMENGDWQTDQTETGKTETGETKTGDSETDQTMKAQIPEQTNSYPPIRVLLMNTENASYIQDQVILQSSAAMTISGTYTQECAANVPFDAGALLCEGETIRVCPKENTEEANTAQGISVLSLERNQGIPAYEGILEIHRESQGLYIVNEVELETYLKYVVPSEMPSSYPQEALKAQAVCARTYAVRQMMEDSLEEYGADVDDTVSYQVYNNIGRQDATDLAVDETAGKIICWEHEPIQAYFFSTSCGFTSSDEVWSGGDAAAYLKSISLSEQTVEALAAGDFSSETISEGTMTDEEFGQYICGKNSLDYESEEPWYRWELYIPWEEMKLRAAARFSQIGELLELSVERRSAGGAATILKIKGTDGEAALENEYRIREFLSPGNEPVLLQDGTSNTSMKLLPSAYILLEKISENEQPSGLLIHGGGYGHGVGMSQNGAKYLAQDGMNWEQILSVFYRDTTIETAAADPQDLG